MATSEENHHPTLSRGYTTSVTRTWAGTIQPDETKCYNKQPRLHRGTIQPVSRPRAYKLKLVAMTTNLTYLSYPALCDTKVIGPASIMPSNGSPSHQSPHRPKANLHSTSPNVPPSIILQYSPHINTTMTQQSKLIQLPQYPLAQNYAPFLNSTFSWHIIQISIDFETIP